MVMVIMISKSRNNVKEDVRCDRERGIKRERERINAQRKRDGAHV